MVYGDLQIFDIIIFAGIAAFLVFRLRNVLGKRTGFEKNPNNNTSSQSIKTKETKADNTPELEELLTVVKHSLPNTEIIKNGPCLKNPK